MTSSTQEIKNMKLISHHDLNGYGNIGEGVAIHKTRDGRRIFYMAHVAAPKDITSVDVTDINNPKLIAQTDLEYPHLRSNSLSIVGDTMLVAYQSTDHNQPGTGVGVYDISNAEEPRRIGFWNAQGPQSKGCHCLWWVDGEYAHLSSGTPDSRPTNSKDDQFYVILDVKNPSNPVEAGRWHFPGTQEGDSAPPLARHPQFDAGHSLHNANVYPDRPDRAYCAWKDSGVVTLDISDKSNISMIANVNYAPPFPGFTHTVLPLFNPFARIPVCGTIAIANATELPPGPNQVHFLLRQILTKRLTFRGFIVSDFVDQTEEAFSTLGRWIQEGKLRYREDFVDGLEKAPSALIGLLKGKMVGYERAKGIDVRWITQIQTRSSDHLKSRRVSIFLSRQFRKFNVRDIGVGKARAEAREDSLGFLFGARGQSRAGRDDMGSAFRVRSTADLTFGELQGEAKISHLVVDLGRS